MYHVLTCNGYTIEESHQTLQAAIEACNRLQDEADDTYARVVSCDGQLVADAAGIWKHPPEIDPMDVALERRFD